MKVIFLIIVTLMQLILQLVSVSAVNSSSNKEESAAWTTQEKVEQQNPTQKIKSYKK